MSSKFSRLPTWWLRHPDMGVKVFGAKEAGTSIAALKCLLALSLMIDFHTRKTQLSFSDLEALTGLSRPMIPRGLDLLVQQDLIEITKGYRHEYLLTEREVEGEVDTYWGKLPYELLRRHLKDIGNRGTASLAALKIYVSLVAARRKDQPLIPMSYDTFEKEAKIQRRDIRAGLSALYSAALLHAVPVESEKGKGQSYNAYFIRGLGIQVPQHTDGEQVG